MTSRLPLVSLVLLAVLAACSAKDEAAPTETATASSEGRTSPASTLPARWWLWAESAGQRNPITDRTGKDCGVNQPEGIWFLAGTFGQTVTRTCTIPAGRPVYFPIMNLVCEVLDADQVQRALDECDPEPFATSADLDGQALVIDSATSEGAFRFKAGPYSLIAIPNSDFQAVAGGTWVGPLDLSPGDHVLRFAASAEDFELDVTYRLVVR